MAPQHRPLLQVPEQQSESLPHAPPLPLHAHTFDTHDPEQQSDACEQPCPRIEQQVLVDAGQTSPEQHVATLAHEAPGFPQVAWQVPPAQSSEQQSLGEVHEVPSSLQVEQMPR